MKTAERYPGGEYGTTIRFFDRKERRLKVLRVGPILSLLSVFHVTCQEDRIIQDEIPVAAKEKISR